MMTESRRFTVVILGDSWVGKTSLLEQFINKEYNEFQLIIFFNLFETKTIINDDEIDLFLWDTPGLDRFSRAVRSYSKRADGVVLVYDVRRFDTFTELTRRLSHFRAENKTAPAIIVGNKIDEKDSQEIVPLGCAKEFADQHKMDFMEASAKTGENVDEIFERLTRKMLTSNSMPETKTFESVKRAEHSSRSTHKGNSGISLHGTTQKPNNKCF